MGFHDDILILLHGWSSAWCPKTSWETSFWRHNALVACLGSSFESTLVDGMKVAKRLNLQVTLCYHNIVTFLQLMFGCEIQTKHAWCSKNQKSCWSYISHVTWIDLEMVTDRSADRQCPDIEILESSRSRPRAGIGISSASFPLS